MKLFAMKKFIFLSLLLIGLYAHAQELSNLKDKKPVQLSGGLSLGGFLYNTNQSTSRLPPLGYSINANATLSIYDVRIPFSVSINEQGSSLQTPFSRFGLSPTYKWLTLHGGYRNFNWHPFVLQGATFLGGGIELKPGKLRVGAVYGYLNDVIQNNPNLNLPEKFTRKALALKLGYGGQHTFLEFVALKSKDDTLSLGNSISDSLRATLEAQENLSIGMSSKLSFVKNKLYLSIEAGGSLLTEDLRSESVPLDDVPEIEDYTSIFQPKLSTHANYSVEASLNWNTRYFTLRPVYRRVMPGYKSHGVNYLLSDVESYTLQPSFTLFKGKVNVSGSYGIQFNNIDNRLTQKTNRNIGFINLGINPNQNFGVFFQYSNYSIFQQVLVVDNVVGNDSLLINQVNHNATFSPRIGFGKEETRSEITLSLNYQTLEDNNDFTRSFSENTLQLANLNYSINLAKQNLILRAGINYFDYSSAQLRNIQKGASAGLTKLFFNKKLNFTLSGSFNQQDINETNGYFFRGNTSLAYKILKNASVELAYFYFNNETDANVFTENRTTLRINWFF